MPFCFVPRLSIHTSFFCSCRCFSRRSARQIAFVCLWRQSPVSQEDQGHLLAQHGQRHEAADL